MYAREINGQEFSFGVSGKLIRNVLVMYDRQTESYWSQLIGEAVAGEMVGTKLEFLPSWMMPWSEWMALHPDTLALDKNGRRGGRDSYASYYNSGQAGVIGEQNVDERLLTKEFVLGVEVGETAVAYPFRVLNDEPIVNDTVNDTDLLVFFDPDSATSAVYNRSVDGQTLTFESGADAFTLTDNETDSTWDMLTGTAVDGPLAGTTLDRIKSTQVFWFGWTDFHPDTQLYGVEDT